MRLLSISTEEDTPYHANKINLPKPSYWVSGPSGDNGTLITLEEEEYEVG
jgi:hypothetical protein